MKDKKTLLIAGAGGIGRATALLFLTEELSPFDVEVHLGDISPDSLREAAEWIDRPANVHPFRMPSEGVDDAFRRALEASDVLLDCVPGKHAPRMADLAREHGLHYANLTEHVAETDHIVQAARDAETGFVLQTGLAPGFINVLGHGLFQRFCERFGVDRVERLGMRVGALPINAMPPYYYAFTWSPIGVATEYVQPAVVLRDGEKTTRASLSGLAEVRLGSGVFEEALTSGGAADLPDALAGRVRDLDYKTLRHPGHYAWVKRLLEEMPGGEGRSDRLERRMLAEIPRVEADEVMLYAFVIGKDPRGNLHRIGAVRRIEPIVVSGRRMKAIQATTAAGLAESARLLLEGRLSGVVLQSHIDPGEFLAGPFVDHVYRSKGILEDS